MIFICSPATFFITIIVFKTVTVADQKGIDYTMVPYLPFDSFYSSLRNMENIFQFSNTPKIEKSTITVFPKSHANSFMILIRFKDKLKY